VSEANSDRKRRFDALFDEHVASIVSYCRWRSPQPVDHEDVVAEVFLVVWRRLDDVPAGTAARAWLYAVARRVLANQARANARRESLGEKLSAQPAALHTDEAPLTDLVHEVREALASLAPSDREVLLLSEWEGLTPTEIARVMGCPVVTARGRLYRARRRFRAAFESRPGTAHVSFDDPVAAHLSRCER
jgi:RNA polymerase sigma-70 factor (ECF subfamily)